MSTFCEDRVVIVTGAGRGIGREYALMLAEHGAKVVVNDLGGARDGEGEDSGPADQVVAEIRDNGGEAIANGANVADFDSARGMIRQAIDTYGRRDALVNNAGILRDRMLVNMEEREWDAVINVQLKGTFAPAHHAASYWREQSKAGQAVDARLINTTSVSGIYGNAGQTNYGAAKAGIAGFTRCLAIEGKKYGIRAFILAPVALTRLTEDLPGFDNQKAADQYDPKLVSPLMVYLASDLAKDMTGKTFLAGGGRVAEMKVVTAPGVTKEDDGGLWTAAEIAAGMTAGEILLPE